MNLLKKDISLIAINQDDYEATRNEILDKLTNKMAIKGIYITLNKKSSELVIELQNNGINPDNLFFIDAISAKTSLKNVETTTTKGSLTELSIILTKVATPGTYDFIMLDSINSLLNYDNNDKEVVQFVKFLINKAKYLFVKGVFLSIDNPSVNNLLKTISIEINSSQL
ncbi:MAG TPA: hypothetical protein VI790_05525 [Candidatus Nanoarchaeia archaeon]|nr:hypothetical protein [Candidatus Nanoarchaeia archaeon]